MVAAILAALGAAVALIVVVAVVFALRSRAKTPHAGQNKEIRQLDTVGVGTDALAGASRSASAASDVRVSSEHEPAKKPAESLKSRFTAVGVFVAAVFGTLTAKLWSMQILASDTYADEARENLYTTVSTPAPRGYICDANGVALVKNRASLTILADPDASDDRDVVQRLSTVLGVPANVVRARMKDATGGAQSQRVVASDARLRDVAFISEHADAFPGITVQSRTVRDYPYGALAAHLLGYVGTATAEQLANVVEGSALESGDDVGQSGIEYRYNNLLSGDHGQRRVVVDAQGNVIEVVSETQPAKGSDVYLTIKASVQHACDRALAELVAPKEGVIGTGKGVAAAAVVMDVRDGSIVAMGSYPTYDPSTFVGGIPSDVWDLYRTEEAHDPLLNRVTDGLYAAASTFKTFTGLAALEQGFATAGQTWECTGSWDGFETGAPQKCWLRTGHGILDFREGIVNSCDVVFYEIAKSFFFAGASQGGNLSDTALQEAVMRYRFGEETGIDLPSESKGRVPTPAWKTEYFRDTPAAAKWQGGDLTNLVIGQGDVLVTPLQVAVAYGGIATGRIMRPHLLKEVRNATGDVVLSFEPEVMDEPEVDPGHLETVRDALHGVVQDSSSLSALFPEQGIDAAGKTGTAEHADDSGDDAWFACYAPYDDPKYVVACVVEHGGGGSAVAAPLAAEIMEAVMAAEAEEESAEDEKSLAAAIGASLSRIAGSTGKQVENLDLGSDGGRTD